MEPNIELSELAPLVVLVALRVVVGKTTAIPE
jgi:hypothetical protein